MATSGKKKTEQNQVTRGASQRSDDSIISYNPFEHRNVEKPNSDFGALAHVLTTTLGTGILAMPVVFRYSGLVFGSFGTILMGIICAHCIQMLVRSSQVLCRRKRVPFLSFSETAEAAVETGPERGRNTAKIFKYTIVFALILSFILGNTVYVIFMAESIAQVIDFHFHKSLNIRYYILILWIPLILMCQFRNLKSLIPFSVTTNLLVVVCFGTILYYIFRDIRAMQSVYMIAPPDRYPAFITSLLFALVVIGTVIPIENEMRHPEHFIGGWFGIVYIAEAIVLFLYVVVGFFGYLEYGEDTKGSITLNLPVDEELAQIVKILMTVAIFFTYAVQFYVPIGMIWSAVRDKIKTKWKRTVISTAIRAGLVTLTIIISVAVPNLEPIIGLVGAICFSLLGLTFPTVIDILTRWPKFGRCKWRLWKNSLILFLSLLALISGTYASIYDIIVNYKL